MSATRSRQFVFALCILLLAVLAAWKPWDPHALKATIRLSTDEHGLVLSREVMVARGARDAGGGSARIDLDLGDFAGTLMRIDVFSEARRRIPFSKEYETVSCAAELLAGNGGTRLWFIGRQPSDREDVHPGNAGYRTRLSVGDDQTEFAYSEDGHLCHILRMPEDARLRIRFGIVSPTDDDQWAIPRARPNAEALLAPREDLRPQDGKRPDVFIYLIDALRADHLGCYGYERSTSPTIDAFAQESILYEQAQCSATWTRPSIATMLTGLYPSVHGVMANLDVLADWPMLLPEALQVAGYTTLAVSTNEVVSADFGMAQGYDEFVLANWLPADWVNRTAKRLLLAQDPETPVFLFAHAIEPHSPYSPTPEALSRFDRGLAGATELPEKAIHNPESAELYLSLQQRACVQDLYDAEIFEADRGFSGFVDVLRETGRYEGAFILLVADHGESFGEHGTYFHGGNLNQEELRVPLIIRLPGGQHGGHRVEELVSLVDIFPTVLEWTGSEIENNYPLAGMVLPLDEVDATRLRGRPIFAELAHDYGRTFDLVCVIDEFGHKRVLDLSGVSNGTARSESVGLWDTMSDPLEESDLSGTRSVHAAYGKQLIGEFLARQEQWRRSSGVLAPGRAELSEEAREKLKALGYLR